MRSYRMGLIQTAEQLKFSYMAIIAGAKRLIALAGAQEVNNMEKVTMIVDRVKIRDVNKYLDIQIEAWYSDTILVSGYHNL